ncbi:MFS transporter [Tumebacillus lipolyticus]|uniref:MFS transporter n=1 Tax=Tumebacillus lipolyticus TaxID=1280370 RepID=A0ABW4ZRB0_9BACL
MFQVLKYRDFRLLWLGLMISNFGTWAQLYAEQWFIFGINGSALDVSLLVFVQAVPNILFMVIGGILADRFDRKKLLFFTQGAQAFLTLLLALLISMNMISLYLYLSINFLYGLIIGLDIPARRSIVPNIVPMEHLSKALSIYNATFQLALFAGPVIGSTLVALFGYKTVFFLNAATFTAILYAVWQMKIPEKIRHVDFKPTVFAELRRVGTVFQTHHVLLIMVILNFLFVALGRIDYLFPSIATHQLKIGVEDAGWLNSSLGIGFVVGSLVIGTFETYFKQNLVRVLLFQGLILCTTSWLLSVSTSVWMACVMIAMRGAFLSIVGILISNALQIRTPDEHLGKVMGVQSAVISLASLASFPVGLLVDRYGVDSSLQWFAVGSALIFCYMLFNRRHLRKIRTAEVK